MATVKRYILPRQSVWDIAAEHYGSVEGVKQLMVDNPTVFNFENTPVAGTLFFVQDKPLNKQVVEFFAARDIKPATAVEVPYTNPLWILYNGYWGDNRFWLENAIWKD